MVWKEDNRTGFSAERIKRSRTEPKTPSMNTTQQPPAGEESADAARYAACPFCGEDWLIITMFYLRGKHFVACKCGAQGPLCDGPMEARAAWELRHNAPKSSRKLDQKGGRDV